MGDLGRRAVDVGPIVEEFDQDGEVVVVAERLGQHIELRGERAEHAGRSVVDQLHLIPEVLDRLAPLVKFVIGGVGPYQAQCGPSLPVGRSDPVLDRVERTRDLPASRGRPRLDEQGASGRDPIVAGGERIAGRQCRDLGLALAGCAERSVVGGGREQRIERRHDRMRVA